MIETLNYYRVTCDGLDEKTGQACKERINVAALDHDHLNEVLDSLKNKDGSKWVSKWFTVMLTFCPKHMNG